MAWNEPGGSGNKDPWGSRNKDQGPPDLDEVLKNLQNKIAGFFGKKGGGADGGGKGNSSLIGIVIVAALVIWALTGIYIVDPAERGVVQRFGEYTEQTQPGPHWHLPFPIESVTIVNVDAIHSVEVGYRTSSGRAGTAVGQESLMLTQDENIVDIQFAVQYRIKDAKDYLFSVRDPDQTLRNATESGVREIIGKSTMDFVLTQGQSEVADRIEKLVQEILDRYQSGLLVTSVNMQSAQPPKEVKGAFDDAIKAREDQERLINEAQAYSNDILPKARGNAARQLEEANGYKARVVAEAQGEASRFDQLLVEYKKAPKVTRERLYIETIESVMDNTSKIMLDTKGGNNLIYLPLDKLDVTGSHAKPDVSTLVPQIMTEQSSMRRRQLDEKRSRDDARSRGSR